MDHKSKRHFSPDNRWFVGVTVIGLLVGSLIIVVSLGVADTPPVLFCNNSLNVSSSGVPEKSTTWAEIQMNAIVHYATSRVIPQQSLQEIRVSLQVLKNRVPCNFLVFGLGHDSVMWASLNPGGTTLFLEEDPKWVDTVLQGAPHLLHAHTVKYRTQLSQADQLLRHFATEPACWGPHSFIHGNHKCLLALNMLPEQVLKKEWDLIMIDAPRGYFPEAPGRMAAIYSAAVMARNRKSGGVTDVFLHDVDRKVERVYSDKFLCPKNLVKSAGRLRHYKIPPAATNSTNNEFC